MRFGKHRLQLLAAHSRFLGPARSQTASAHTNITPTHTPTSGTDTWATHTYTTEPTRFDSVGERLRVNMCVCLFLCVCDRERECECESEKCVPSVLQGHHSLFGFRYWVQRNTCKHITPASWLFVCVCTCCTSAKTCAFLGPIKKLHIQCNYRITPLFHYNHNLEVSHLLRQLCNK